MRQEVNRRFEQTGRTSPQAAPLSNILIIGLAIALLAAAIFLAARIFRPQPLQLLQKTLRDSHEGDRWVYRSDTTTSLNGFTAGGFNGTVTRTIERYNQAGAQFKAVRAAWKHDNGRAKSAIESCFFQEPLSHDLYEVATQRQFGTLFLMDQAAAVLQPYVHPTMVRPGSFKLGQETSYSSTFDAGETEQSNLKVVGSEIVSTPAGRFWTWRLNRTTQYNGKIGTFEIHDEEWFAPQIGVIKLRRFLRDGRGMEMESRQTLQETNVK